jgi:hypothetical protein
MAEILHCFITLLTVMTEDTIRPKKKDQTIIGYLSKSQLSISAKEKVASKTPNPTGRRNGQETVESASLILIERIALMSSSYMPRMRAMVPPDTPGITFAAPIKNPLIERIIKLRNDCDDIICYYHSISASYVSAKKIISIIKQ